MSGLFDALHEGWMFQPFSIPLLFLGLLLLIVLTVVIVIGEIAAMVGNDRVAEMLVGPSLVAFGVGLVLVLFSLFGWWVPGALLGLGALAFGLHPDRRWWQQ